MSTAAGQGLPAYAVVVIGGSLSGASRFAQIARRRGAFDQLGRTNRDHRCLANGFTLSKSDIRLILKILFQ